MSEGVDRVGPIVFAFVAGMLLVAILSVVWGPDTDNIRRDAREEVHAEYIAERTLQENEMTLENLVWSIKRIDGELEDLWDRLEIAGLLDEKRLSLQNDMND